MDQRVKLKLLAKPFATSSGAPMIKSKFMSLWKRVPRKRVYDQILGTEVFRFELTTTGASETDDEEIILTDDGIIREIKIHFPAGSQRQYYVTLTLDQAQIFPNRQSQQIRGDDYTDKFSFVRGIPFQRDARLKGIMISDAALAAQTVKSCQMSLFVEYERRGRSS